MSQIKRRSVKTQFGLLCIVEEAGEITRLDWGISADDHSDVLHAAEIQMLAYARGELETFDLPMNVKGTNFQRDVCAAMFAIPFGYTRTYGDCQGFGCSSPSGGTSLWWKSDPNYHSLPPRDGC